MGIGQLLWAAAFGLAACVWTSSSDTELKGADNACVWPICWENTINFFSQKSINTAVVTEQTTEAFD